MNATPSKFDPRGPLTRGGKPRKPIPEMLAKHVVQPSGCWEWTGTRNRQNYGVVGLYVGGQSIGIPAPRLQWMHHHGQIPEGLVVMHVCDNPPCINPSHLALGTQATNLADMRAKGRGDSFGLKNNGGVSLEKRYAGP